MIIKDNELLNLAIIIGFLYSGIATYAIFVENARHNRMMNVFHEAESKYRALKLGFIMSEGRFDLEKISHELQELNRETMEKLAHAARVELIFWKKK
jgi:hypothetical protein